MTYDEGERKYSAKLQEMLEKLEREDLSREDYVNILDYLSGELYERLELERGC